MDIKDAPAYGAGDAAVAAALTALLAEVRRSCEEVVALGERVATLTEEVAAAKRASERLWVLDEVAERWQVSPRTVENLVAEGALVPTMLRGARRFTRAAVEAAERAATGRRRRLTSGRRNARRPAACSTKGGRVLASAAGAAEGEAP